MYYVDVEGAFWNLIVILNHRSTYTPHKCVFVSGGEVWCDCTEENMQIKGGSYTLTKNLKVGSMLVYQCPEGYYPYPHLTRLCQLDSSWRPAPRRYRPQRCKSKWVKMTYCAICSTWWCGSDHFILFCSGWMPRPQCAGEWDWVPSSGEVLCGQWDHDWVLLWIQTTWLIQTFLLTKHEVERLHAHL